MDNHPVRCPKPQGVGQGAIRKLNRWTNPAAPGWLVRNAPAERRQARPDLIEIKSGKTEKGRAQFEPGQNLVLTVEANLDGDTLKLLARGATPIDQVAAEAGASALRIHLNRPAAVTAIAQLLSRVEGRHRARISLTVADDHGREIDLTLPDRYPITPQIKGAIKAIRGVVLVEDL